MALKNQLMIKDIYASISSIDTNNFPWMLYSTDLQLFILVFQKKKNRGDKNMQIKITFPINQFGSKRPANISPRLL